MHTSRFSICCFWAVVSAAGVAHAYEPVGMVDWVHHCGSYERDASQDLCGISDGSFYVTGWYEGRYDTSIPWGAQPHNFGLRDIFVSKYNAEGELLWVRSAGSGHCDVSGAVHALDDGTCVITGGYGYGTASCQFGYGQANFTVLGGIGRYDVCVAKYDGDGILQWAKRAGGSEPDFGYDIALTPDGAVFVAGSSYSPSITLGHGLPTQTTLTNPVPNNPFYFLARYAPNGTFEWAQLICAWRVVALSDGGCVCHTMPGLARFSANGTLVWSDANLATTSAALASLPGNEFVAACSYPDHSTHVTRFVAEDDGSVLPVWEATIPECTVSYYSPMSVQPGGPITFCAFNKLYTVAPDGSWFDFGPLDGAPVGIHSLPDSGHCYVTESFYSDVTVGGTTLVHKGEGDFYLARVSNIERYKVAALCQNPGWVDFHRDDAFYWHGETATLTAVSAFPGIFEFAEWGGVLGGTTDPEVTFPVMEDTEVIAVFEHVDGAPELPAVSAGGLVLLAAGLLLAGAHARRR